MVAVDSDGDGIDELYVAVQDLHRPPCLKCFNDAPNAITEPPTPPPRRRRTQTRRLLASLQPVYDVIDHRPELICICSHTIV